MDSFVPSWIQVVFIEGCVTHEAGSTQAGAILHLVTKLSFKSLKKKKNDWRPKGFFVLFYRQQKIKLKNFEKHFFI